MVRHTLGWAGCLLMPLIALGCGNHLGPITARQEHATSKPPVPTATVERLKTCMDEYVRQLPPGSYAFHPEIHANQKGVTQKVLLDDVPSVASDFAGCTRQVLGDMALPAEFYHLPSLLKEIQSKKTDNAAIGQRPYVGSPIVIVVAGVTIVLADLVLQAGGYTILFAISVALVEEGIRAVSTLSEECQRVKAACIESCTDETLPTGTKYGVPFHRCLRECMERGGCFYNL